MFVSRTRISSVALGAFAARVFAIFFIGCDGVTRPDLVPKGLSFDANNVLTVTFKNEGNAEVPAGVGGLAIFIDGEPVGGYLFGRLVDQSFRSPNGTMILRTNFRMSGADRRIAVALDPENEIAESNEFQNTMSRTMTPPPISGPDFVVSDLGLVGGNVLTIQVRNIGPAASPLNLSVHIRVIVNEVVAADLTPALPVLAAGGGTTTITPNPPIVIAPGSRVRALLNTNNLFDEIDNTNGVREEILPGGPSLLPYTALLGQPVIANNAIWRGSGGVVSYTAWTVGQRNDLNNAIVALETGSPQVPSAPPTLFAGDEISASDAWAIYVAHVAQSLWVEVHNAVSWHLDAFTPGQLAFLLDSRKLMAYNSVTNRYRFETSLMGTITAWNPRFCYEFLSNLDMIKASQLETIYAFTDWMRGHVIHISSSDVLLEQYGYAGPPPADKILYPLEGKRHISAECWGTSGLFGAVLRSVNIPVERLNIDLDNLTHSRPSFPSVDRSMPHADEVYNAVLSPSGGVVPSSQIFYSGAEMNAKFLNPPVDCVGGNCNTVGQQAGYNLGKSELVLAYAVAADYLLYDFAQYGAAYLNDRLRGPSIGGVIHEYVRPYFTPAERTAMVGVIQIKVQEIGSGDLDAGKAIVIARWNRFNQNK